MFFTTSRLQIIPLQQDDWPCFLQLHTDAQSMAFISDLPQHAEIRQRFLQRLQPWQVTSLHMLCFTLRLKTSQQPVGFVGINAEWWPWRQAEVGYALQSEHFGHGYMAEALAPIVRGLFSDCQFHKLYASVVCGNLPSRRILEQCDFQFERTRRQQVLLHGEWVDEWLFGCLLTDIQ
ncbi:MAG: hypothetical protein XXXJIFNMEKO3_01954 [Candidatus Erwinia impunctatus]|nr:hypothetical protein XXXJIFNMEKO_01954 [Culicoides impunctatus]